MRSTLTRIGENSKMIITGDTKQIDIKKTIFVDTVIRMFSEKSESVHFYSKQRILLEAKIVMIEEEFDTWEENSIK
jgi:phosphate starvation-inducible protein PhoH